MHVAINVISSLKRIERTALIVVLSLSVSLFAVLTYRTNQKKGFSIDEFQYAHASWLISKGHVPYRDFFEVHFPLVYQYASLFWHFSDDDPSHILQLRLFMLPVLALCLIALAGSSGPPEKTISGLLTILLALACVPFISFAIELRPDPIAFAFYAAALGIFFLKRIPRKTAAYISGIFLGISLWGTQKAWLYAAPMFLAWAIDIRKAYRKRQASGFILGNPFRFALGVMTSLAAVALYLTATRSWAGLYTWCIKWAFEYQQSYPGFSWTRAFGPLLDSYGFYLLLAGIGVTGTLIGARNARKGAEDSRLNVGIEHVLVASLLSSFASFAFQRAPWDYSMIPFLGLLFVFAARGLVFILLLLRGRLPAHKAGLTFLLLFFILLGLFTQRKANAILNRTLIDNSYQLSVLREIGRLTAPSDAAYDNSGSYVSRPHAYFYYYSEKSIRVFEQEMLVREVPQAIENSGTILVVRDLRFGTLPEALKSYLEENFQKYNGDLWFWGRLFRGEGEYPFNVIKSGKYFFQPFDASYKPAIKTWNGQERDLRLDGKRLDGQTIFLEKGIHWVSAKDNETGFYLLWLPRDGKPWAPQPKARPRYSRLF